jgi:hypothetical protein
LKLFTITIFSFLSICAFGQDYSKSWIDVNYAGDTMRYHQLDIYLPEVRKPIYPVAILIYGSAWFGNDLKGNGMKTIGKALLDNGYADPLVPYCQSEMLFDALQKNNVRSCFTLISDAGHGPGVHEEKYFKTMIDFLNMESKKN